MYTEEITRTCNCCGKDKNIKEYAISYSYTRKKDGQNIDVYRRVCIDCHTKQIKDNYNHKSIRQFERKKIANKMLNIGLDAHTVFICTGISIQ